MSEAARDLILVLVDCSTKVPPELDKKYGIQGYPTVLYVKPDGERVGEMRARDANSIAVEFKRIAKEHNQRASYAESTAAALEKAKEEKKPLLLFIADGENPVSPVFEGFLGSAEVKPALEGFVVAREECAKGSVPAVCEELKIKKGAMIVIIDPTLEKPYAKPIQKLKPTKSPAKLRKELEEALAAWKKQQEKPAGG